MYEFKEPTLAKLFVSLILAPQTDLELCAKDLIDELGPVDRMSGEIEKLFMGLGDVYISKPRVAALQ